jgi:ribonuclease E
MADAPAQVEAEPQAPETVTHELVAEAAPTATEATETAEPAAPDVVELAPTTAAVEPEPEPSALEPLAPELPAYDPNEIVAPPTAPRRGWWRRGA